MEFEIETNRLWQIGSLPVAFVYSFFVEHYVSGMTGSIKE